MLVVLVAGASLKRSGKPQNLHEFIVEHHPLQHKNMSEWSMAKILDIHPQNPQPRLIEKVVSVLNDGGLIAYPTDSSYALGCALGNADGKERIARIRQLDDKHHYTLVCKDFAQLGTFVHVATPVFRAVSAATPGSYTFILEATKEVPRRLMQPKKRTVGVRIPDHIVALALVAELGEPILSSSLLLPGQINQFTEAWQIDEAIGQKVDLIIDAGECSSEVTTVVDLVDDTATIVRVGAGDPEPFE